MKYPSARLFLLVVLIVAISVSAHAQSRSWVAGEGDDANPCSRTAPCKTFAGAISKTSAGGEISVLDPGSYGAVTITKSITINGRAQVSGIMASAVNGVVINAGANDVVVLRHLDINGGPLAAPGINGIRFVAGKTLSVEHCNIHGFRSAALFSGRGIDIRPTGAGVVVNVFVSDTTITNGGGAGIAAHPAAVGPTINLHVNRTIIKQLDATNVTSGIFAGSGARVSVRDSEISGNTVAGIDTADNAIVFVDNTQLIHNSRGVQLSGTSIVRLSRSVIAHNITAGFVENAGTSIEGFNDNRFFNNGANVGTLADFLPD